jgi:hypothetical protein
MPPAMNEGEHQNTRENAGTEPRRLVHVDDAEISPVHFAPPVREWIAYLAERLARELIRESKRPAR